MDFTVVISVMSCAAETVDGVIYHSAVYIDETVLYLQRMSLTLWLVATFAVISGMLIMLLYIVCTVVNSILFVCHFHSSTKRHITYKNVYMQW